MKRCLQTHWAFALAAAVACDRPPTPPATGDTSASGIGKAPLSTPTATLGPLDPEVLFRQLAPSIVVIHTERVFSQSQGSGVVIAPERVITNVHVLERGVRAYVSQGDTVRRAFAVRIHPSEDLAELEVPGLTAPAVATRSASTLKPGERVYAIGAPLSLELTISDGLVSGLRPDAGGVIIQTSASISPGSSGGGLFDQMGKLVGITTFKLRGGENVNFALPTDWFAEMVATSRPASAEDETPPPVAVPERCERQSSGLLAASELTKLSLEGSMVLPRVLSLHVRNRTRCTIREILVTVEGTPQEFRLTQSWDDPLRPGEARMFRGEQPPASGWDKAKWRMSGAR